MYISIMLLCKYLINKRTETLREKLQSLWLKNSNECSETEHRLDFHAKSDALDYGFKHFHFTHTHTNIYSARSTDSHTRTDREER